MFKAFQKIIPFQLSFLIWMLPIIFFLNFNAFFYHRFERFDVYTNFAEDKQTVLENFDSMMNYINLRNGILDDQFFSIEDVIHLSDVRNLVAGVYLTTVVLIVVMILNKELIKKEWISILKSSSQINLISALLLIATVLLSFNYAFIIFHKIFFRNDYWILDPSKSNLIKYFPQEVFFEIAIYTTVFVIMSSILGLILWKLLTRKYS